MSTKFFTNENENTLLSKIEGVAISLDFVDHLKKETYLNDTFSPFEFILRISSGLLQ